MRWLLGIVCLCGVSFAPLLTATAPQGEAAHPTRRLLYPQDAADLKPALKEAVAELLTKRKEVPDPEQVSAAGVRVFVRVLPLKHVVDEKTSGLKDGARLGARPFVFLTTPEALYGKSLAGSFAAIGYSAEEAFLKNGGEKMAAVVFKYPGGFPVHPEGECLPEDGWDNRVYPATWDNLFCLTERMVRSGRSVVGLVAREDAPKKLSLRSEADKAFVLGYPKAGKDRLRRASYASLKGVGGADWEYRQLLERCWSASEHFRGDGRTKLTYGSPSGSQKGFPEFVGPNLALSDTGTLAVIYLGTLKISE
jgi:hypothetical protein